MYLILLFITSITFNAIGDGKNNDNEKTIGHIFNAFSILVLLLIPSIIVWDRNPWVIYILSYAFLRAAIFDIAYNLTRGLPWNYIGSTSITDKLWVKFGGQPTFVRIIFLIVGISLPLKYLSW
jgi:hypothetical protein